MPPDLPSLTGELCELSGPSGHEGHVARAVVRHVRALGGRPEVDPLGTVAVRVAGGGRGPALLVSAHMDEVGFVIRRIEADGFLRLEKVGGTDNRVLPARPLWVHTLDGGLLPGHIGTRSAHLLREADRTRVVPHDELYADIGADSESGARRLGVAEGCAAGYAAQARVYGAPEARYIVGKSLDDRAGCAVQLALLHALADRPPPGDVVLLFTVQEEVGLRGAGVAGARWAAAYGMPGDADGRPAAVALAVDATAVGDTPEVAHGALRLGAGPAIKAMDNSLLPQNGVRRALETTAHDLGLAYQREVLRGIGTDAGALGRLPGGVPAGVISIPSRYSHSPVEMVDLRDLQACLQLLEGFVRRLPEFDLRPWGGALQDP